MDSSIVFTEQYFLPRACASVSLKQPRKLGVASCCVWPRCVRVHFCDGFPSQLILQRGRLEDQSQRGTSGGEEDTVLAVACDHAQPPSNGKVGACGPAR